jgi:hypothetical protein
MKKNAGRLGRKCAIGRGECQKGEGPMAERENERRMTLIGIPVVGEEQE